MFVYGYMPTVKQSLPKTNVTHKDKDISLLYQCWKLW